jgi:hypothetical protein
MIRELYKILSISQEILNTDYELSFTKYKEVIKDNPKSVQEIFNFSKTLWLNIENYSSSVFERGAIINVSSMMINH